jgi:uncharacterized membrane protein (DUF485 family)
MIALYMSWSVIDGFTKLAMTKNKHGDLLGFSWVMGILCFLVIILVLSFLRSIIETHN